MMKAIVVWLLMLFLSFNGTEAQELSDSSCKCSPSLMNLHPGSEYFLPFCQALKHYPELKGVQVKLKFRHLRTTMATMPALGSVFRSPAKRIYVILVDTFARRKPKVYFDSLDYNARIAISGHELGHVVSYQEMRSAQFVWFAIRYVFSPAYRATVEHQTDEITIQHGLGNQLYDLSDYIFNRAVTSEKYRRYKSKYYYQPLQIRKLVDAYEQKE